MTAPPSQPKGLQAAYRRLHEPVNFGASLLTLGGAAVAGIVLIWSLVSEAVLALALLALVSLVLNVVLMVLVLRYRSAIHQIQQRITAVRAALGAFDSADLRSNKWLSVEGDLSTLRLDESDWDEMVIGVTREARQRLGPDARVWPTAAFLLPEILFQYWSYSEVADTSATFHVRRDGSVSDPVSLARGKGAMGFVERAEAPWRSDDSWKELIRLSWLRMRPFTGDVRLRHWAGKWTMEYVRIDQGVEGDTKEFVLENGSLKAVGS